MDDNRLCNINGSPFRKMSRLRVLSMRNNKMSSLPETIFKPLRQTMYSLDVEGKYLFKQTYNINYLFLLFSKIGMNC